MYVFNIVFFFCYKNFRTRGWCPSRKQGRPPGLKRIYKDIYIYLPPKALAEIELKISRIQDLSFYH